MVINWCRRVDNYKEDMNKFLTIKSEVCLTPTQCYPVKTEIPWYVALILAGSVALIIKEIYTTIK